jgi:hypothetical protein
MKIEPERFGRSAVDEDHADPTPLFHNPESQSLTFAEQIVRDMADEHFLKPSERFPADHNRRAIAIACLMQNIGY